MKGTYKIAGRIIAMESVYSKVHELCADYRYSGTADFSIRTTRKDIEYEGNKSRNENIKEGIPIKNFSDDYLETLAVYRKIADKMIDYDTILFHGSVIAVDGIGYLFTAKSGTGKSTHTRLWRELFGERAVMVNDDKPLIKVSENGIMVCGTPWDGKHRLSTNISVPLKAVCVLERSEGNHIEKVTADSVYNMLVQQVYRPQSPQKLLKTLQLIDVLSENVGLYRLGCNMDISAAETAYKAMKG
ncbi:MAG: hypothetical protein PUB97_09505 [Ruminococcus sp.]|nr:hypothetical protein [Ruminococcus sp.]